MTTRPRIPSTGRPSHEVLGDLSASKTHDARFKEGRTWSLVYFAGEAHHDLLAQASRQFLAENALNPMAFPSLHRMESEVVQMTASLLHGPDTTVGTMTSGGTESILLAVKTARDRSRARRPWLRRPNMVLPASAHVAFDKAGHLFGVRVLRTPVDDAGQADVAALRRCVDRHTVLIAASAPQYPTGAVDPIPEIAAIGQAKGIPVHVDACFGGFILPWLEQLGVAMPVWDFRVPGVTSMSADLHKYGYAAKGASVILYRDMSHLRHQFFVNTGWQGGIYISPSLPGTRPGGPIAAAWAAMHHLGADGYLRLAERTWAAACRLRQGIEDTPGLRVLGSPHAPIVTWASDDPAVDVYVVADLLQAKGWNVDRQQAPASIHCSAAPPHLEVVDDYLADIRQAVAHARAHPELSQSGAAAMYGMMARIPLRGAVDREVLKLMETMYGPDGALPEVGGAPDRTQRVAARILDAWDALRARLGRTP